MRMVALISIAVVLGIVPPRPCAAQTAAPEQSRTAAASVDEADVARITDELMALEVASHDWWLEGDLEALDALMMDEFHFVAMNGAIETKREIVGSENDDGERAPRPLQIEELRVEPKQVVLRDNEAAVISVLHIRATVQGRAIPGQMTILSVFLRDGSEWKLFARSITPILTPPR